MGKRGGTVPAPHVSILLSRRSLSSGFLGLLALLALDHGVGHDGGDQLDGADRVVVAGDGVVDLIGITVGIGNCHHGDTQFVGFSRSEERRVGKECRL